ncbi:hypothetical protein [Natrinema sp. H-ect4]|uniref:hypothetical protein n=1 Tax=Natrinema sp. H-ect4 TaxID=3242699 RepID=UPI0035A8444C
MEEKNFGYFISLTPSYDGNESESRVEEWQDLFGDLAEHDEVEKVAEIGNGWMFFTEYSDGGENQQ